MITEINLSPSRRSGCMGGALLNFNQDEGFLKQACIRKSFANDLHVNDTILIRGHVLGGFGIFATHFDKQ